MALTETVIARSCATHALGQMPLAVELVDAGGALVYGLSRNGDGSLGPV